MARLAEGVRRTLTAIASELVALVAETHLPDEFASQLSLDVASSIRTPNRLPGDVYRLPDSVVERLTSLDLGSFPALRRLASRAVAPLGRVQDAIEEIAKNTGFRRAIVSQITGMRQVERPSEPQLSMDATATAPTPVRNHAGALAMLALELRRLQTAHADSLHRVEYQRYRWPLGSTLVFSVAIGEVLIIVLSEGLAGQIALTGPFELKCDTSRTYATPREREELRSVLGLGNRDAVFVLPLDFFVNPPEPVRWVGGWVSRHHPSLRPQLSENTAHHARALGLESAEHDPADIDLAIINGDYVLATASSGESRSIASSEFTDGQWSLLMGVANDEGRLDSDRHGGKPESTRRQVRRAGKVLQSKIPLKCQPLSFEGAKLVSKFRSIAIQFTEPR